MPLCSPTIVGPVSEVSVSLRVQGALPGATILVVSVGASPRDIAKGTAVGGDDRISLISGVILQADDILIAKQELGGETSPELPTSLGLSVQNVPSDPSELEHVGFRSHLYKCGQYLWITGAIPGATVEVEFNGSVKGMATAYEDGARVQLEEGLPAGKVTAWQSVSSLTGKGPNISISPDPVTPQHLPPPVIKQPVLGCQTAVLVSGVYDGATVTLQRGSGIVDVSGFDMSALWFNLNTPLDESDTISVKQDLYVRCEKNGVFSSPEVSVGAPKEVPAPVVVPPLCAGGRFITVANVVGGAVVIINVNGTKYRGMAPRDSSMHTFMVDPIPLGTVIANQELCSMSSPQSSPAVQVDARAATVLDVKLLEPLFSCGRAVFVEQVTPGATLQVWRIDDKTKKEAPISDRVKVYDTEATIDVTPYLGERDGVRILQWACGDTPTKSNTAEVKQHPNIEQPIIVGPVYSGTNSVDVSNAVPGAKIEVYLANQNGLWEPVGFTFASPKATTAVTLNIKLAVRNQLRVTQSICSAKTVPEATTTVILPPPAAPKLDKPPKGATVVERKPTLSWHDPGAGQDNHADSYELEIKSGSTVVTPLTVLTSPSFQITKDLDYATNYTWQVRARNTSGLSDFASSSFTVQVEPPPPPPPPPVIDSYDRTTGTLKGKNFLPSHTVYVRLTVIGSVTNAYGYSISDYRTTFPYLKFTSDSTGNLQALIDPKTVLPVLPIDDLGNYVLGCASGEQLFLSAHDERPDSSDITGFLWSNTFTLTC